MAEEKRELTVEEKERIMKNAPDYIIESSDIVKDLFVAAEWAKQERDLCHHLSNISDSIEFTKQFHYCTRVIYNVPGTSVLSS